MINTLINKNENNLSIMLSIIKIGIIAFISIIIYINLPKYWADLKIENNGEFNLYTSSYFLCITGSFYIIWLIINRKTYQSSNVFRISWLIENIFFISIISLPIYLSTVYENEYKYLFLLLIISSVIQYGSRYGIITSLFSSVTILSADLLYAPIQEGINIYFQKDLILAGIFIFVAWIIGYYVDMEFKNNKTKDDTLNLLSSELEEKDEQRKEMEALLLNNKICYDMLFENSLNAIIVHRNGMIIYANRSTAKLLGYENLGNLNGKNLYNHYVADTELRIQKKYSYITYNKLLKIIEEENILKCNGELIPVINTSSFFTYKGEPSIMTFLRDITSEKQVESLQEDVEKNLKLLNETMEFNNLITNFFTNMSHELKTPVNVIYAAIQTINLYLGDYKLDNLAKCKSYLKIMKQNCLRMIRLINNLLDITKLDSGFIKINKKNGDIVNVIEDIVQSIAGYVKSKEISLIFDTNIEEEIIGFDHDMIERIMLNLISNAVKYSHPNGHIYVNVIDKKSSIIIEVKDEGEGIPKDKINVIFERFGQVNNTLSRKCEGTGIGLYLVKSFVEMHGGKISVLSEEGRGSQFLMELPVVLDDSENPADKVLFKTKVEKIEIEFSDIYSIKD